MRGTTTTGKGARGCTACPRGTELFNITQGNLVAPSCRPCAADTFQPSVVLLSDNPECLPCAEGFRTAGASTPGNRSRCARCKPGRAGAKCLQCGENSWAAGWAASNNKNLQCRTCTEGTEAPAGSTSKAACQAVLAGDNVAQWPNIGSAADKVPQATAGDTGIPVLRKTACGAPWVSLGASDGIDNAGSISLGSVDWHGASAANPGFAFVGYVKFRGPHRRWERLFDFNEQTGQPYSKHVLAFMRTSSTERMYPSNYGWQWNAYTQAGVNLEGLNGTWHIIALSTNATALTSYTSAVNTYNKQYGGWLTTPIPTSPADYKTPYSYIGKATWGDAELANIDLREMKWWNEALTTAQLQAEIAALKAAYPGPCYGYDCGPHGGCFEDPANGCAAACACSQGYYGTKC
ncbi:hypothetical protein OEZ85_006303 [Tetradesmus obliquus]|uniref:EGF-like domain-containing protein n=1 Tax=Tetradesmus obliquus TaxID=3088 RepID=A0ABY8TW78_TETOB|nr:hypothetical protein OEZ85_006303 [Tetradesmus obliquus]